MTDTQFSQNLRNLCKSAYEEGAADERERCLQIMRDIAQRYKDSLRPSVAVAAAQQIAEEFERRVNQEGKP